ncbi:MAG: DUF1573 domain-containing protein [Ekhidna sp.]
MKVSFSILFVFLFSLGFSQEKLSFDNLTHNFGELEEENGPAEHTFYFVNNGDGPIQITRVKASCGCTTPGWTKEEVMPGDSGFVKAKYNPRNRPGKFTKSLRITSTDASANKTLYINGFVKPKVKTPEEEYPVVLGDLRVKYRALNFGKITTKEPVEKLFDIYNASDSVVKFNAEDMNVPEHITVSLVQSFLNPKEVGKLSVVYDPIAKNDFGYVSDAISIGTNEEAEMSIMGTIEEYFPIATAEELDKAPKLNLTDRSIDFGKVKRGEFVKIDVTLENTGKSKLNFRAIKANCGCITYDLKSQNLKKGKSQTLKLTIDTSELRGNQYKIVTLFSNDPVSPTQIVTLKGKVEK